MRTVVSAGRRLGAALLLGLLALWLFTASAHAAASNGVVLTLERGYGSGEAAELVRKLDGRVLASIPALRAYLVTLEAGTDRPDAVRFLERQPSVDDAAPDRTLTIAAVDPLLLSAWHLSKINAPGAWTVTQGSPGVGIAIVDTGIDYTHPDLAGKVVLGPDYGSGDADPRDTHGHGTHVAGIAAAIRDNGTGSAGVCPGCTLIAVKVFPDGSGSASSFAVAQGITWAADNGAKVINLSLGSPTPASVTQSAVDYAWSRGAIVVAAAGNSATSAPHYPAAFPNAIAVGSTTSSDTLSSFSNYGAWVDVTAPGSSILSTVPGGSYQSWNGTSMATPVVAGAAGLTFSGLAGATNASVRARLEAAVADLGAVGRDATFGFGRIDLQRLVSSPPATPAPSVTTSSLPRGTTGSPYTGTLVAGGGTLPHSWSLASGSLPGGLAITAATGAITGTPTAPGARSFTVRITDGSGRTATRALSISIVAPPPPTITTTSLPPGTVGSAYTATLAAGSGKTPYTWSLSSGSLPAGLTLNPSAGTITGTPATAGGYSLTLRVTDANDRTALRSFYLSVVAPPPPSITTASVPRGTVGSAYTATLVAVGGKAPYTWSLVSGSLPSGLTLTAAAGTISGTPTVAGGYSATLRVTDANNRTAARGFYLSVVAPPPPSITTTTLPPGTVGGAYTATLIAGSGKAPYTWSLASGALPGTLTLNSSAGTITGTPTVAGGYSLTLRVTDANSRTALRSFYLSVFAPPPPMITTASLPAGTVATAYTATLAAGGGKAPYRWALASGSLPAGLTLDPATGTITGTPTVAAGYSLTLRVTDADNRAAARSLMISIVPTPAHRHVPLPARDRR